MITSELITTSHQARKALIYIRQSTPHQVLTNQESLRLQYALQQRALDLGWRSEDIEIIDSDLGLTGAAIQQREGFKEVVAQVTLGQVGIILSSEVTRLSRNCTDWYPLLDICGYKGCLIADRDGIYDPGSTNGRLLLGLKGQLSELELHTIRARMTAGLLNKARRGELSLRLPVGLVHSTNGQVVKDPHLEVQDCLGLVFDTFLRVKSACKVLHYFNDHDLDLPRHNRFGDLVWKKPTVSAILSILKNPAYAGAFVYGRSRTIREVSGKATTRSLPKEQWKIIVQDKYPAYLNWDTFERIQAMLQDNYAEYDRNQSRGVPRSGAVLLHGIVYCGECGHKMVVQYKGGNQYLCNYLRQVRGVPVCQRIPADPIDERVVQAFFQALSPLNWMPTSRPSKPREKPLKKSSMLKSNNSNACAMRLPWPNVNMTRLTQITGWWPQNWNGAGKPPWQHSSKRKKPLPASSNPYPPPLPCRQNSRPPLPPLVKSSPKSGIKPRFCPPPTRKRSCAA